MWFQEVKPFFLVARIYGLAPYSYVDGSMSESKPWKIYAYLFIIVRLIEAFIFFYVHYNSNEWNFMLIIIMALRSAITSSVLIIEGFVFCRSFNELKTVIEIIENHDRFLRINFTKKYDRIRSWLIIVISFLYLFHELFRGSRYSMWAIIAGVHTVVQGGGWFAVVFKFVAIVNSIERRFRHLSDMVAADTPSMVYEANGFRRPVRLTDIHRMHCNLTSAATIFNEIYNMILLIWIGLSIFYSVTNIYYALLIDTSQSVFYNIGLALVNSIQDFAGLVYLLASCQSASEAANKVGYTAFSPSSCVVRGRFPSERDIGFAIGQYFKLNSLQFTAAYGFVIVELPLLGTVFAAITTAVIVLSNH